uniref:FAD-binding PCMH-type domain-containing protein n=1 Tax=Eutreptiella gymnastica TaxID=73025 RepID=A0A7S4LLR5_9EUGL
MELANWSGTHTIVTDKFYQPETVEELQAIVEHCHATKQKVRPVGTCLSPNGIAMNTDAMVSMSSLNDIIRVDPEGQTITVQAGIKVSKVLQELQKYGLTLQNFSSIQDQQMGGWTQVAAHGTGAGLPTVEEMITRMKMMTATQGEVELSETQNPELFRMAKVGLGCLGVVTEMTLRCIPQHNLLEKSWVTDMEGVRKDHTELLDKYRHVRYMWLPRTEKVVVVVSNPHNGDQPPSKPDPDATAPLRRLLGQCTKQPESDFKQLNFAQLRDELLTLNPLDPEHVVQVNKAEAEFWVQNAGHRLGDSTDILGFECGGSQWVLEVAFPIKKPLGDIDFMQDILSTIEKQNIPAPAPIEQRWTARSHAPMSPAHSNDPNQVFSWVGVIMYLPPGQDDEGLQKITDQFEAYTKALGPVYKQYGAVPHWAKIEAKKDPVELQEQRDQLKARYPVAQFNTIRQQLDPHNIFGNDLIDSVLR